MIPPLDVPAKRRAHPDGDYTPDKQQVVRFHTSPDWRKMPRRALYPAPAMNAAQSPRTLTFLFTDIEGSTPLWDKNPAAMRASTERHNALLRGVIDARGGEAFRVVGDAF